METNPLNVDSQGNAQVNLKNSSGTEVGTAAAPLRVDPTGTTTQPVSIAATVAVSGPLTDTQLRATPVPVSGTVTAANASVSATGAAPPASATYMGGSVTTASPSYTTGQMSALSLTTGGSIRTDSSTLGGIVYSTGNGVAGTGVQRVTIASDNTAFSVNANAGTNLNTSALALETTLGTVNTNLGIINANNTNRNALTKITDGTRDGTVKAASTAAVAADTALVVAISPNNTVPVSISGNQAMNLAQVAGTNTVTAGVSGLLAAGGNVASAATDSGNPLKTGAIFNTTLPTVTNGQRVDSQADANGRHIVATVPLDGAKATYSASANSFTTATTPTDVFTLTGSATKTIRILSVKFNGSTTSGSGLLSSVVLIKRSTANTGGTSSSTTKVPHDSTSSAATATVLSYTANPTVGTTVGNIRSSRISYQSASSNAPILEWSFGGLGQGIVLRGTSEVLAINLNSVTITGGIVSASFEWTEE